jgi:hypothetical protein
MSDPFKTPPGTNPPRHVPPAGSNAPFIGGAIVVAVALAVGLWAMNHRTPTTAANPPAVTAAPAPATRAPAPADNTTGRAIERPTPGERLDPIGPAR